MDLILLLKHLVLNKYQQVRKKRRSIHSVVVVICVTCTSNWCSAWRCVALRLHICELHSLRSFVHIFFNWIALSSKWTWDMDFFKNYYMCKTFLVSCTVQHGCVTWQHKRSNWLSVKPFWLHWNGQCPKQTKQNWLWTSTPECLNGIWSNHCCTWMTTCTGSSRISMSAHMHCQPR